MRLINIALILLLAAACSSKTADKSPDELTDAIEGDSTFAAWPVFNADSAYSYVKKQVDFGPRVPGSEAHRQCRDYLTRAFANFGADTVIIQQATVTAFDGTRLPMSNILARFNTSAPRRILVAAHYDTRPWADEDADKSKHKLPIDGANDGASGVGVILELARNIQAQRPEIGVDFLLTDVEDYGTSGKEQPGTTSWALGSQYWAQNSPYTPRQRPAFGILLDMVGGKGAKFYREYFSENNAAWVNAKIWEAAAAEGITRFINERQGGVTDDHIFISRAGIPCIDIIECANPETGSFPRTWHTMNDNIECIDPATLQDVGVTIMRVIYSEKTE